MNLSEEWSCDYRVAARESLTEILECRMKDRIDRYMEELGSRDGEERRSGYFSRHLLTELGDIELHVPRTHKINGVEVVPIKKNQSIECLVLCGFGDFLVNSKPGQEGFNLKRAHLSWLVLIMKEDETFNPA